MPTGQHGLSDQIRQVMHDIVKVPKVLKVHTQRLKGSQKWEAKVVYLEGSSVSEYMESINRGRRTCLNLASNSR